MTRKTNKTQFVAPYQHGFGLLDPIGRMFRFEEGSDPNPAATPAATVDLSEISETIRKGFEQFVQKKGDGDAENAGLKLWQDNYELRQEVKRLKGLVPADGSTVLTADEAAALVAYQELGDVEALKEAQTQLAEATSKLTTLERTQQLRDVADAAGYKFQALADMDKAADGLEYEIRDIQDGDKTTKVPHVKHGETFVPLSDYVAKERPHFVSALGKESAQSGTQVVPQDEGGQTQPKDAVSAHLEKMNERAAAEKNALTRQQE